MELLRRAEELKMAPALEGFWLHSTADAVFAIKTVVVAMFKAQRQALNSGQHRIPLAFTDLAS